MFVFHEMDCLIQHLVDDGLVLNLLPAWAPDASVRKKILVDNPARPYEF